jgi:uncharacterized protein Yka (UPF0111/DUF47 family)
MAAEAKPVSKVDPFIKAMDNVVKALYEALPYIHNDIAKALHSAISSFENLCCIMRKSVNNIYTMSPTNDDSAENADMVSFMKNSTDAANGLNNIAKLVTSKKYNIKTKLPENIINNLNTSFEAVEKAAKESINVMFSNAASTANIQAFALSDVMSKTISAIVNAVKAVINCIISSNNSINTKNLVETINKTENSIIGMIFATRCFNNFISELTKFISKVAVNHKQ